MISISRKKFLSLGISTGVILTVPQILSGCSSLTNKREKYEREDVLDPLLLSDSLPPILKAIRMGMSAPNPHNVQPWKFRILNETSAFLYVDEKRILKETDPPSRQIHIGQGTFLETLYLAIPKFGYVAEISLFPEGKYGVSDIGKKAIAKIILKKQDGVRSDILSDWISERMTRRTIYSGPDLTLENFDSIRKDADIRYSEPQFILKTGSEKIREQIVSAMGIETNSYNKYEESRIWFRYDDEEILNYRDGISLRGSGVSGLKNFAVRNFFLTPGKETWHSQTNRQAGLDIFAEQVESAKGFIFLKTKKNEVLDWVQAGRDYARLHLAVTKNGFSMHPMSQILQEFPEMDSLRKTFESELHVSPGEKIQMFVRLGQSDYRYFSPRRKVEDLILP